MKGRAVLLAAISQIIRSPSGLLDLQTELGISEQSASAIIKDLRDAGLIYRCGKRPAVGNKGGRPTVLYGWVSGGVVKLPMIGRSAT